MRMSEIETVKRSLLEASKSLGGLTESEAEHYARAAIAALDRYRGDKTAEDIMEHGVAITHGGKRVAPEDFYISKRKRARE
jgi:hypothetical protein